MHLVGAVSHGDGRLLGQVDAKTNETTVFRRLLRPLDLTNVLVTADALHTVRANLDWLVTAKNAHYLAVIKKNQPTMWAFLACPGPTSRPAPPPATMATAATRPAASRPPPSPTSISRTRPRRSASTAGAG
ncbi:transposase [Parafrankia sp. EAN1pec]|uniref:transposase n=1 Tax=Parafrankia sp. (strain EAN1pec) TaxID=298653 RepID=UPI0032190841